MIKAIRYLRGYVRIRVWGTAPERFMNLCSMRDILLWDIVQDGDVSVMNISIQGFRKLRPIVRKTGTRVAILEKNGLPFFMPVLWKRKVFLLGFLLCLCFWIFSSFFIWDIELTGNYRITEDVFLDYLKRQEVTIGMRKQELDINSLEKGIRRQFPEVTWASARLDGTKLLIQIKENETASVLPEPAEEGGKDLVAACEGTIVAMIVRSGVPKVSIGDVVTEGTVLVEGKVPVYNEDATVREYQYVVSDADIVIEHGEARQETLPFTYIRKEYTGRTKVRYFLRAGDRELRWDEEQPFLVYDSVIREKTPALFEKLSLPVSAGSITHREYQNVEHIYSRKEAEELLLEKIKDFFASLEEKGVQIIEKDVTIKRGSEAWVLDASLVLRENAYRQEDTPLESTESSGETDGQGEAGQ